ncbi:MAG: 7-carboxy-7-deazaguanine synthase QueE [Candidatus Margulisbacteria bacterium]|jgi:organic radical activating enzyme|nr:7-carboxy-7-deazaguanine synthase QueE [Candidatus Margulisiibacteriota bacterium]
MKANIQEIFRSIQGEGRFTGAPTVFVRFSGCNLRCAYCDTRRAWRRTKYCRHQEFGRRAARFLNDISAPDCAALVSRLAPSGLVSFTGGEPLLQARYIAAVIDLLGARHTYLIETNGTLPGRIKYLPARKNIIYSIDIKNKKFEDFYRAVPEKSSRYIKIVLEKNLDTQGILKILGHCYPPRSRLTPPAPELYLQPAHNKLHLPTLQKWLYILDKAGYAYKVLPQMHKFIHIK